MSFSTLRVDTLLITCRLSCADDSYVARSLSVNDYEKLAPAGQAVRSAPILVFRMIGIRERHRQHQAVACARLVALEVVRRSGGAFRLGRRAGIPYSMPHALMSSSMSGQ